MKEMKTRLVRAFESSKWKFEKYINERERILRDQPFKDNSVRDYEFGIAEEFSRLNTIATILSIEFEDDSYLNIASEMRYDYTLIQ